ncbi:MAG: YifB family Mg chelatase-like AAA ATPase [Patescibacteria group bacterium]|nr:YifB family Mg chelatase-like AAA ATPase [Patescibacteria group bacterium]MDD5715501.1 YifB family Mg chelatase-like AAA ATPase [Patescibacteria group bacterium]
MSAKVLSAAVVGLDASLVDVEADLSFGLPKTHVVGLPDMAVQEARERVRSGIRNSGFNFPPGVITVNLAPAHLRKEGPSYDLPIAVAIIAAYGEIGTRQPLKGKLFIGELSLDGTVRPVSGVLSIAALVKEQRIREFYVPERNAAEAALVHGIMVYPVRSLSQLVFHLRGGDPIQPYTSPPSKYTPAAECSQDMAFIRGQEQAKRALEIAAAGGHNVLMTGPPGSGKTLLARTMPSIFPPMQFDESLEVTKIYSVAGLLLDSASIIEQRPFRSPHHTTSSVALVGGGSFPKPGEVSLAHRGVLFLDEFAEFSRHVLESLRQPLEDGRITVSRAAGSVQFPARFTLIAARNPCPCGYYNDPQRACTCSPQNILKYQKKISGPLLDRIDIHIHVPRLPYEKIAASSAGETSERIRERVVRARDIQRDRLLQAHLVVNAEMSVRHIGEFCRLTSEAEALLKDAVNHFYLSGRTYHRIIKVARTIADISSEELISAAAVAEALQYRSQAG